MRGPRLRVLLVGLTAALPLAACGVPPSGVIEAGAPASGVAPAQSPAPDLTSLFFLRDGEPAPYARAVGDPGDHRAVMGLLFAGPTDEEAATATTELPRLTDTPDVTSGGDGTFLIRIPQEVAPLSRVAMLQLACTAAHLPNGPRPADVTAEGTMAASPSAAPQPLGTSVHVIGDGWELTQSDDACP